ncbi:MAG: outer membrane beta-barrel protein [Pseudomonadota bacterium]
MKQLSVGALVLIAAVAATPVNADDAQPIGSEPAGDPFWSWTGAYVGAHVGAAWGTATFSDPFGPSIYGDNVNTPAFAGGIQAGYNWQIPGSPWVLGAEADVSRLVSDGTNTCLAYSGFFVSANCRARPELAATLTGRVGLAAGPSGRSLLYLKGGLAGILESFDIATNAALPPLVTSATTWRWGGTVGAGIEHALAPAWSLKLEYDWMGFGAGGVPAPGGFVQVGPPAAAQFNGTAPATTAVSQSLHVVKLGLNYRFGVDGRAGWPAASAPSSATPKAAMPLGWEAELGGRYWFSSGRFQKDLGSTTVPATANALNSRLTYDTTAHSGEFFGRVETPWNIFAKGFIGAGSIATGTLNDEDWLLGGGIVPYSNTLSVVNGSIDYATVDLGYDLFRGPDHKLGIFVGYNYYAENKTGLGCAQFANMSSDCTSWFPTSVPVITENNTWRSLRVGVNGEMRLFDSLKLGADIAYLPYVQFDGTDNHVLRGIVSPEWGTGNGVQLEAVLSYYLTPEFSIGVGGRYWAMWTNDAYVAFGGSPCPCNTLPSRAERYGVFLQASYRFAQFAGSKD